MGAKHRKAKPSAPKTRKELRKDKRKQKKVKKHEYYTNRTKGGKYVLNPNKNPTNDDAKPKKPNINKNKPAEKAPQNNIEVTAEKAREKEKREQAKLHKEMQQQRNKQLIEANEEEDKAIKRLEKQLKLNKRKTKAVPKSFAIDGLDYLLEVCDSETMKGAVAAEQQLLEVNDGFEEDFALMTGENAAKKEPSGKKSRKRPSSAENEPNKKAKLDSDDEFSSGEEIDEEEDDFGDEIDEEEDDFGDEIDEESSLNEEGGESNDDFGGSDGESAENDDLGENNEENGEFEEKKAKVKEDGTWEDIYGRLRNKDGLVVTISETQKYIPPAIRAKMESDSGDKVRVEKLNRLKKQLKGYLNRLAESNMHGIASSIEELYMNNSRNDMNHTITSLILEALATNVVAPERLLMEHVLLITILHANVGSEVGAHFLQSVAKLFAETLSSPSKRQIENKFLDNYVNILAQLYNFKLFDAKLIFEILSRLSDDDAFDEKHVECILHILRSVGFGLRKDNPLGLKNLIINLQKRAADVSCQLKDNARVKFMLDILLAIKNNNVTKIPNYDTSYSEHLKKIMKGFIRKGNYVTQLNISLDDLLKAEERGRWWVVGSAWAGNVAKDSVVEEKKPEESFSQSLLALAKKQRMNTDTRRNIFCIIMSAEDYLDAFEKLLRLSLKNQQEREIIHVILHCCLQEKTYNPYYAYLAQKLCENDRKYQMTIKYSIWDKLKALNDHSAIQVANLAKLLSHLFMEKGLPISTLKVVEFGELDKLTLRFMRQVLLGILLHENVDEVRQVFDKVAQSEKLKMFRESLRLFIHHFLLKNLDTQSGVPHEKKELLQERAKIVGKALSRKSSKF